MYQPTDSEREIMLASQVGDIIELCGQLCRIVSMDDITPGVAGLVTLTCDAYVNCDRDADYLMPHLTIGYVPACERCHKLLMPA